MPPNSKPWAASSAPGPPSVDAHMGTRTHRAQVPTEMDQHSSSTHSSSALVTSDNGISSTANTAQAKGKDKIAGRDATGHYHGACSRGRDSGKDTENKQAQKSVKKQEDMPSRKPSVERKGRASGTQCHRAFPQGCLLAQTIHTQNRTPFS